jgi:hypothetical protein
MRTFDLAIAWNWEYDQDFISGIEHECAVRGITTYKIDPQNLNNTLNLIRNGEITFRGYYDRASDADAAFIPLVEWMESNAKFLINPYRRVLHAIDKATMHMELMSGGLFVPDTIILSPFNQSKSISLEDHELNRIHKPFVIKPANTTGGGTGVILNASTVEEIRKARQENPNDKYLVQETIKPKLLNGKRGWFRVYFAFGEIILCWWDNVTHQYTQLLAEEERDFQLSELRNVMMTIQRKCELDFFSSEIALTDSIKYIVVDYVNEVCDMRLQSVHYNGAPDAVVHKIERLLAEHVYGRLSAITKQT